MFATLLDAEPISKLLLSIGLKSPSVFINHFAVLLVPKCKFEAFTVRM